MTLYYNMTEQEKFDLLNAYDSGKEIEWRAENGTVWEKKWNSNFYPCVHYRVKDDSLPLKEFSELTTDEKRKLHAALYSGQVIQYKCRYDQELWAVKYDGKFFDNLIYRIMPEEEKQEGDVQFDLLNESEQKMLKAAFAKGKPVQWRSFKDHEWKDKDYHVFYPEFYYRLKPEDEIIVNKDQATMHSDVNPLTEDGPVANYATSNYMVTKYGFYNFNDLNEILCPWVMLGNNTRDLMIELSKKNPEQIEYNSYGNWLPFNDFYNKSRFKHDTVYRQKKVEPKKMSFDWSALLPEFKWAFVNSNDNTPFATDKPPIWQERDNFYCIAPYAKLCNLNNLASFVPGEVKGKDSLIKRPEDV